MEMGPSILKVPLLCQGADKYCSIVCLQMLMHYYNDKVTLMEMESETKLIDGGEIHIENAALFALKRGYTVFLQHHNKKILDHGIDSEFKQKKQLLADRFLKLGGHYSTDLPSLELLNINLAKGIPTICIVNNSVWHRDSSKTGNHYVVVCGKKIDSYLINDPSPSKKESYFIDSSTLLSAWHSAGAYTLYITR